MVRSEAQRGVQAGGSDGCIAEQFLFKRTTRTFEKHEISCLREKVSPVPRGTCSSTYQQTQNVLKFFRHLLHDDDFQRRCRKVHPCFTSITATRDVNLRHLSRKVIFSPSAGFYFFGDAVKISQFKLTINRFFVNIYKNSFF